MSDYGVLYTDNINLQSANEVLTREVKEILLAVISGEKGKLSEIIKRMSEDIHSEIRKFFTKEELNKIIEKTKDE